MTTVLTIAGSDSGGGAGIQADLKSFKDFGIHGTCAVTAVTAQNTCGVQDVHFLPFNFVANQIYSIVSDMEIKAVKLGMLGSSEIVNGVAEKLEEYGLKQNLVVDPVMVSASGDVLLEENAVEIYKKKIVPMATVLTPNLKEVSLLVEEEIKTGGQKEKAAVTLLRMGAKSVLLKCGDEDGDYIRDIFYDGEFYYVESERLPGKFHGTGCTLSSSLAACLARGETPLQASKKSLQYLQKKLHRAFYPGKGSPIPGELI